MESQRVRTLWIPSFLLARCRRRDPSHSSGQRKDRSEANREHKRRWKWTPNWAKGLPLTGLSVKRTTARRRSSHDALSCPTDSGAVFPSKESSPWDYVTRQTILTWRSRESKCDSSRPCRVARVSRRAAGVQPPRRSRRHSKTLEVGIPTPSISACAILEKAPCFARLRRWCVVRGR